MTVMGREYRVLARLRRWQIIRVNIPQSVMEHSYSVALIADRLREYLSLPIDPYRLMKAGLLHDLDEIVSGDTASPAKTPWSCVPEAKANMKRWQADRMRERFPWYVEEEDAQIRTIIGVCDFAESIVALIEEERSGNREVYAILDDCKRRFYSMLHDLWELDPNVYRGRRNLNGLDEFFNQLFSEHAQNDRVVARHYPA